VEPQGETERLQSHQHALPRKGDRSHRTRDPPRIVGEVTDWKGHSPEVLTAMRDGLEKMKLQGVEAIND